MKQYVGRLIQKYSTKGIIVDTNLLLFYLIGEIDLRRIKNFHRTKEFAEEDFYTLSGETQHIVNTL